MKTRRSLERHELLAMLAELKRYLETFKGESLVRGVSAVMSSLDGDAPDWSAAASLFTTLIQSKNQLADFHVEPIEAASSQLLNRRIGALTDALATELMERRFRRDATGS